MADSSESTTGSESSDGVVNENEVRKSKFLHPGRDVSSVSAGDLIFEAAQSHEYVVRHNLWRNSPESFGWRVVLGHESLYERVAENGETEWLTLIPIIRTNSWSLLQLFHVLSDGNRFAQWWPFVSKASLVALAGVNHACYNFQFQRMFPLDGRQSCSMVSRYRDPALSLCIVPCTHPSLPPWPKASFDPVSLFFDKDADGMSVVSFVCHVKDFPIVPAIDTFFGPSAFRYFLCAIVRVATMLFPHRVARLMSSLFQEQDSLPSPSRPLTRSNPLKSYTDLMAVAMALPDGMLTSTSYQASSLQAGGDAKAGWLSCPLQQSAADGNGKPNPQTVCQLASIQGSIEQLTDDLVKKLQRMSLHDQGTLSAPVSQVEAEHQHDYSSAQANSSNEETVRDRLLQNMRKMFDEVFLMYEEFQRLYSSAEGVGDYLSWLDQEFSSHDSLAMQETFLNGSLSVLQATHDHVAREVQTLKRKMSTCVGTETVAYPRLGPRDPTCAGPDPHHPKRICSFEVSSLNAGDDVTCHSERQQSSSSSATPKHNINITLDTDLLLLILNQMSGPMLAKCSEVCQLWRSLTKDQHLWQVVTEREFSTAHQIGSIEDMIIDWAASFRDQFRSSQQLLDGPQKVLQLRPEQAHETAIRSLQVSSSLDSFLSGGADGQLKSWCIQSGACTHELGHEIPIKSIHRGCNVQDPDSVFVLYRDASLWTVDTKSWHVTQKQQLNLSSFFTDVEMDGKSLMLEYGGSEKFQLHQRAQSGENTCFELVDDFCGHTKRVVSLDADWATGRAASGGKDRMVRLWDLSTRQCLQTIGPLPSSISAVQVKQHVLVSASSTGSVVAHDLRSRTCLMQFNVGSSRIKCLKLDHLKVVAGDLTGVIQLWDWRKLTPLHKFVNADQQAVTAMDSIGDLDVIAGYRDGSVKLWKW